MADLASLREITRHVVRTAGVVEVREVTRNAGGRRQVVIVVDVAVGAGARRHGVLAGEGERSLIMIEARRGPGGGAVARLATLRETVALVIRIAGVVEIGLVAVEAGSAGDVVAAEAGVVAIRAGPRGTGVHSGKRPTGSVVIEGCVGPLHGIVAARAIGSRE